MYWSASRSAGALIGACSISKATPSRFEAASAAAVSMSTEPKPTKAVLPCSSARMTLFSRGISAMALSLARSGDLVLQAAVDAARVALVDLAAVLVADADRVDVALGVIVVVAGLRVDAAHGADHLRGEENVVGGDHLEQKIDAGLVIDARVEEHVVQQVVLQQRLLQILSDAPVAAPVVRDRAAAVGNDELQARKVLEEIGGDQLHERGRVAIDVMTAGRVEVRVAGHADVDHRRHVELDHLLVERIPPLVGQRRVLPVAPRRIGIQVAADEAELLDAALELGNAVGRRHPRRLRELAHADEVLGKERAHAMDQVVAHLRPVQARGRVADVVPHAGGPRREDRHVGPALALELELGLVDRLPDLIIADADGALRAGARGLLELRDLLLPIGLELLRCRRAVAVTIDDHEALRRGTPE